MADTDLQAPTGKLPEEVGFRDFHPMWSFPPAAVKSNHNNITFGMDSTHFCDNPTHTKDALCAQCRIVVFKASIVLQSLGVIASRNLLPSSDVQGESRERAYFPTTWDYAYTYDTPSKYSDALFEQGALPILAHECVLSVIAQMSNKNPRTSGMPNVPTHMLRVQWFHQA